MKKKLWIPALCLIVAMMVAIPVADRLRARATRKAVQSLEVFKDEQALLDHLGQPYESRAADDPFVKVYIYAGPTVWTSMLESEWPFFAPSLRKFYWSVQVFVVAPKYKNDLNELNDQLKWGPEQFNRAVHFSGNSGGSS